MRAVRTTSPGTVGMGSFACLYASRRYSLALTAGVRWLRLFIWLGWAGEAEETPNVFRIAHSGYVT